MDNADKLPNSVLPFLQYGALGLLALVIVAGIIAMFFGAKLLDRIGTGIIAAMQETSKSLAALRADVQSGQQQVVNAVRSEGQKTRESLTNARNDLMTAINDIELEPTQPGQVGRRGSGPDETVGRRRR